MTVPRLILLPGMGVDERLFHLQRDEFPFLEVPAWLSPEPRESLAHYAERMAASISRGSTPSPLGIVLGGVSLGGMLALEISRHLPVSRIVLIASARDTSVVSRFLKLSELASRSVPLALISWSRRFGPLFLGKGGNIPQAERALLARILMDIPAEFLRWAGRAALEWPGAGNLPTPIMHIHGERDWVLPVRRVLATKPHIDVQVVPGGAHVLNLSNPREVNAFLHTALDATICEAASPTSPRTTTGFTRP